MRRTFLENEAASITIPDESETRLHYGLFRLLTQRFVLTNEMAHMNNLEQLQNTHHLL
jgi:hypothetical protein